MTNQHPIQAIWGDCLDVMENDMEPNSVGLVTTSPPYYNARDYSTWPTLDDHLNDMLAVMKACFRVLKNNRAIIWNVADVLGNDGRHTKSAWGTRKIPLGAHSTLLLEEAGFTYVDDIVWDKGQVQSHRHKNASNPYPFYQLPMNAYEHIIVAVKHAPDASMPACPSCNDYKSSVDGYKAPGLPNWECKNPACPEKSPAGRGKRFSHRSNMMHAGRTPDNKIDPELAYAWRRDIVPLNPVVKINSKGENTLGHTAPFPEAIPEWFVKAWSHTNDIVLDPFAGSFTTAIAAAKAERVGIGIERNKDEFREAIIKNVTEKHGLDMVERDAGDNTKKAVAPEKPISNLLVEEEN